MRIGDSEVVQVDAPAGYSREIPAWMVDAEECVALTKGCAQVDVRALEELHALLASARATVAPLRKTQDSRAEEAGDEFGTQAPRAD